MDQPRVKGDKFTTKRYGEEDVYIATCFAGDTTRGVKHVQYDTYEEARDANLKGRIYVGCNMNLLKKESKIPFFFPYYECFIKK